jgi:hypothetical protein
VSRWARGRAFVGVSLSMALGAGAMQARADRPEAVDRAQALFEQGLRLVDAGRYPEACARFKSAQSLVMGIGVTLHLGDCYEQTGRLEDAWNEFRRAEDMASSVHDNRGATAGERAVHLWPMLPKLKIVVSSRAAVAGLVVTDQGTDVDRSVWDTERPVEPSMHHLRATAPDRETWDAAVDVPSGGATIAVQVPVLREARATRDAAGAEPRAPVAAPSAATATAVEVARRPDSAPMQRAFGIALLGAAVVGAGVGTVFGLQASSKLSDSNSSGHCQGNDHCDAVGLAERSDAVNAATVSTIALVGGAACLLGGGALYLTAPKNQQASVALRPQAGLGGASLLLQARW